MNIIDPHIHLINLEQGQYQWLSPNCLPQWDKKEAIHRSFFEADLALQAPLSLQGFVHIEAGFDNNNPCLELAWLEQHCTLAFKSIAYLDITVDDFAQQLLALRSYTSVIGIRDILDAQAVSKLTHSNTPKNMALLAKQGWIFEAQLDIANAQSVMALSRILTSLPNLSVVINHSGKPNRNLPDIGWIKGLEQLASFEHCWIKCSGWEMQNQQYKIHDLASIISRVIQTFGLNRVMMASNFPVATLVDSYQHLWQTYQRILKQELALSTAEIEKLCVENAKRYYKF